MRRITMPEQMMTGALLSVFMLFLHGFDRIGFGRDVGLLVFTVVLCFVVTVILSSVYDTLLRWAERKGEQQGQGRS